MTEGERFVLIHFTSRTGMATGFTIGAWQFLAGLGLGWPLIVSCFVLAGLAAGLFTRFQPSRAKVMHNDWKRGIELRRNQLAAREEQERFERYARARWELQERIRCSRPPRDPVREAIERAGRMKEDGWMLGNDYRR